MSANENDEISTSEEDKKFASEAVKFVIGHTRNGFVSLCASVATLLKEKANLELENDFLKKQLSEIKESCVKENNIPKCDSSLFPVEKRLDCYKSSKLLESYGQIQSFKFKEKNVFKIYKPIKGCLCTKCNEQITEIKLTPPLKKGDRIVVAGEMCGSVQYIGHVDHLQFPEIFIGLYLDEAVGDCNGVYGDKRYFKVPKLHGLFVSLVNVCCVIE